MATAIAISASVKPLLCFMRESGRGGGNDNDPVVDGPGCADTVLVDERGGPFRRLEVGTFQVVGWIRGDAGPDRHPRQRASGEHQDRALVVARRVRWPQV